MSDQEQGSEPPEVSAGEIADQVATIHRRLDEFKEWSMTISEWLENERRRFRKEGKHAEAAETLRLIQHVDSVFLRIEEGDGALRPGPSDGDGGSPVPAGEADAEV